MKTILQIEDNFANKRLVERVLEPHGYRLLHAADGQTGIDMAFREQPDLILLDMGLPDMDGQTLVAVLRESPQFAYVPIVALTAWPEAIANEMASRYGCTGCISKPISVAEFAGQIAAYLEG
ncbi:response regulator [Promineifilum sp.]|uniref:response regulator n=1 Tax=Promineifilum sp. TaxID=2664178 RepID=UPI0035B43D72